MAKKTNNGEENENKIEFYNNAINSKYNILRDLEMQISIYNAKKPYRSKFRSEREFEYAIKNWNTQKSKLDLKKKNTERELKVLKNRITHIKGGSNIFEFLYSKLSLIIHGV